MNQKTLLSAAALAAFSYALAPTYIFKARRAVNRKYSNTLYLSFDDGPSEHTEKLLELLRRYHIRASFFVLGEAAEKYPEIIAQMQRDGHFIGMHSYSHRDVTLMSRQQIISDYCATRSTLANLGVHTDALRPPWGRVNPASLSAIKQLKLKLYLWDVMAQDWRGDISAETILSRLRRRTKGGSIICLHDGRGENAAPVRTIAALSAQLPKWIRSGYRFDTLEGMHE